MRQPPETESISKRHKASGLSAAPWLKAKRYLLHNLHKWSDDMKKEEIQKIVRERYGNIAIQPGSSCCCGPSSEGNSCCGTNTNPATAVGKRIGYSNEEINRVPEGANLGLGCGNPVALASLRDGETVLDLGSGAGFDCFLVSSKVGPKGKVIGIDMTAEMLDKARENARKGGYTNVEFRLGEIENLPVADDSIDAIISNCVINLSSDKQRVFDEAFRVLKPGGRLMVSDVVILKDLPENIRNSTGAYTGCVAGAMKKEDYLEAIEKSGFDSVEVVEQSYFPLDCVVNDPMTQKTIEDLNMTKKQAEDLSAPVASVTVQGIKSAFNK
jgi:SAM-dependent methyltransferase